MNREIIRKIIELTAFEDDSSGDVWGMDTVIGTMDDLIDDAMKIVYPIVKPDKAEQERVVGGGEHGDWLFQLLNYLTHHKEPKADEFEFDDYGIKDYASKREVFVNTLNELAIYYDLNEYHNINHIKTMIDVLDDMTSPGNPWYNQYSQHELKLLKMAILFHDVIYVPGGSYNEEMSADYAKNYMQYFEFPKKDIETVVDLIYHTKVFLHKDVNIKELDIMNLMHDLDFYTFSLDYDEFKRINLDIIKEQRITGRDLKWFQDNWYKHLLDQIEKGWRLYCTSYAQEHWEPKAIDNLKRILGE